MTAPLGTDWQPRARRLADTLIERGDIQAPAWAEAVAAVPRHVFTPTVHEQDGFGHWQPLDVTPPGGLDRVYSPTTLVTALADKGSHHEGISSSTKPDLMLRMLELLDVRDGNRVLEIGTGTGYNAALLAHRLGDEQVFSVDLDADLVDPARKRLASIGHRPRLAARDGAEGLPEHAPFDRIIATCSVPRVPQTWCEQLAPGGCVLTDLKLGPSAGNLVLLQKEGARLEGRFTDRWAAFMSMRHHRDDPHPAATVDDAPEHTRPTTTPPMPWQDNRVIWFLAHLIGLPGGVRCGMRLDPDTRKPTAGTITASDGSHAAIQLEPDSKRMWAVTESGSSPLWSVIEQAHQFWVTADQPDWPRLGLTVTTEKQRIWLDAPDSPCQWTL